MQKLAILIPCYNEEKTISNVIKDFLSIITTINNKYESTIYVFNNASTDNSVALIDEYANSSFQVKRIDVPLKGKGNVVREMFREIDADVYAMVDGDSTYSAKDLLKLVKCVENGADMVIGDRLSSTYYTENKRPFHNFGNKLVKYLINKLYGTDISDIMTGYRTFSKRFVKCMPVMSEGFQIETEMTIFALNNHFNIASVPIDYKDRPVGSSSKLNTYIDGAKVLVTIAKAEIFKHPFKYLFIFGLTMFVYGLFSIQLISILGLILIGIGAICGLLAHYLNNLEKLQIKQIINNTNYEN